MVGRVLVVLACLASVAHADSPKLARARQAIDAVKYDDAQTLLVDALKDGGNSPAAVAEIYRLSASTAVVLDRRDLAEQYYRRWLALDPAATLSSDLAPKIREPFVKAQAYMNAHGRLVAKVTRTASAITVRIENDPLDMASAATLGTGTPVKLDGDARAAFQSTAGTEVAILDEYGNRLVELEVPAAAAAAVPEVRRETRTREVSLLRRGKVWTIAAGVTLGGGLVLGYLANREDDDVQRLATNSNMHSFADWQSARDRRDRYALVANSLFIATGALAATAAIMFATQPSETVIVPAASSDGVGVTITRGF